ncbi:pantetheine-phosphate adenylyltransferase [Cryomorphaceae bacterium S-15]|uniref:Phosphopantetheine adenylyltransferase n=1 Tax=Acidiluteibacter ferrifornacis TaxID=2692424 RepID=A0A6N9NLA1_9FLAO|nr:pantetheine-phosphate adenylyltransferase [bacterium]NBG66020.1 pantetheine-phosphate adenylyltransferase [Acidiluteibacter ferrifornacis]
MAVFPGSFDPITNGHIDLIKRALPIFDKVIIAIGYNSNKTSGMFSIEERQEFIAKSVKGIGNTEIATYEGLTINFCKKVKANTILRGLRNTVDFEFEKSIAQMNKELAPDIETMFLFTNPEFSAINSSIVRDIIRNGGNANQFLPFEL